MSKKKEKEIGSLIKILGNDKETLKISSRENWRKYFK